VVVGVGFWEGGCGIVDGCRWMEMDGRAARFRRIDLLEGVKFVRDDFSLSCSFGRDV